MANSIEGETHSSTYKILSMGMFVWIPHIVGIAGPIIFPILALAAALVWWKEYTRDVNRETCGCSCWDTVFKGPYEHGEHTGYKHFYFNATANMAKIWILIVIAIVVHYECAKYLTKLAITNSVRYSMLFLYCLTAYVHYYTVWMYVGYYNDDFYSQFIHQNFFTFTELFSTGMILYLANVRNEVTSRKILCIVVIGILHIIASGFDQFIVNVFKGEGQLHQQIRDYMLMIPDIFNVIVPIWLYLSIRRENLYTKPIYKDKKLLIDVIATSIVLFILLMIWYQL